MRYSSGFKEPISDNDLATFRARVEEWRAFWNKRTNTGFVRFVKLVTPPIFLDVYRRLRGL